MLQTLIHNFSSFKTESSQQIIEFDFDTELQQISESTKNMGDIVQDDVVLSTQTYSVATPLAAFACDSLLPMDYIVNLKSDPPPMSSLIHAIILSNDKLVMAKSATVNLRQSSIPFQEFKNKFLKQEVIVPTNIDHVHILSFNAKSGHMEFVSLHSSNLYIYSLKDQWSGPY